MTEPIIESFEIPLYGGLFDIVFTTKKTKVRELYETKKHGNFNLEYAETVYDRKNVDGKKLRVILVSFNSNNKYKQLSHGTIAHECFHAVSFATNVAGIPHTSESEEAYAYLIGWMVDTVYDVAKKHKIRIH